MPSLEEPEMLPLQLIALLAQVWPDVLAAIALSVPSWHGVEVATDPVVSDKVGTVIKIESDALLTIKRCSEVLLSHFDMTLPSLLCIGLHTAP